MQFELRSFMSVQSTCIQYKCDCSYRCRLLAVAMSTKFVFVFISTYIELWIRIRIHFRSWIRICIQYADRDPGEVNLMEKTEKMQGKWKKIVILL